MTEDSKSLYRPNSAWMEKDKGALVLFHAQLGPFQVTMARFYGIRVKETGQNLNEGTRIVNDLPR